MQRTGSPREGCGLTPPTDGLFSMKTGLYYKTLTQIHPLQLVKVKNEKNF